MAQKHEFIFVTYILKLFSNLFIYLFLEIINVHLHHANPPKSENLLYYPGPGLFI